MKNFVHNSIIIVLVILLIHQFEDNKILSDNLKASNSKVKYHKNKYGQIVASKLSLQYELKDLKHENDTLRESVRKFKKPLTIIQTKQVVKIDTLYIPFEKPINCDFTRLLEKETSYYMFKGKVDSLGFKIDNLTLFNNQTIVTGFKRQGLFKKPLLTTEITNTNPYVRQIEIKPIVIVYPQKIYEKWYITLPVGIALGKLF